MLLPAFRAPSGGAILPLDMTYASTTLTTYRSGVMAGLVSNLSGQSSLDVLFAGSMRLSWKRSKAQDATDISEERDSDDDGST